MTSLLRFWDTLDSNYGRAEVLRQWELTLGEAFVPLRKYMHPINEKARKYPNPKKKNGAPYLVVEHYNGTFEAVPDDEDGMFHGVPLELADIVLHRWNMPMFRNLLANALGLTPSMETITAFDFKIPLGTYSVGAGREFPVIAMMCDPNVFKSLVSELVMKNSSPFILVSGTSETWWDQSLLDILREKQIPLVQLCEALEFSDGKFVPTPVWNGAIESFRQAVCPENLVVVPDYEFVRRGGWFIRYEGNQTVLPGELLGAYYLQRLLMSPNSEVHVSELLAEVAGDDQLRVVSGGQEMIDNEARQNYKKRLEELVVQRAEAEKDEDEAWLERIDSETEQIASELLNITGLGGKTRKMGDDVQNLRRRISKNITEVMVKIEENDRQLGRHLTNNIYTGVFMNYRPDREIGWVFN